MSILFLPGTGSRIVPLPFSDFRAISNCHPPMSCHLGPRPDCAKQIYYPEKPETHRDQSAKTLLNGGRRESRRREIPASDREIVQIAFVCVCVCVTKGGGAIPGILSRAISLPFLAGYRRKSPLSLWREAIRWGAFQTHPRPR